jgi:hypothetical protein
MFRSTINTMRNILLEYTPLDNLFKAVVGFSTLDICRKHHEQNTLIQDPEELKHLAQERAEQFSQSPLKRIPFVATKQRLKEIYTTTFIELYNKYLKDIEKAKRETNEYPS